MLRLGSVAPWLLLVFLGHQVSLSSGRRTKNRGADGSVNPVPVRARGKFTTQDRTECAWTTRHTGDAVTLFVRCEDLQPHADEPVTCQYTAKPRSCPEYLSDPKGFWKQVGRALKKMQDTVCTDKRALVRVGMCKHAPREAHFKLNTVGPLSFTKSRHPPTPPPVTPLSSTPAATTPCAGRADHRKTAEEYCSGSWASVCSFIFSMVQSDC